MQIRSFRGSGEPVWVVASLNACLRLGPDPRRALGPAAIQPHQQAGHMTAPDQSCSNVRKFLPRRRPHMTQSGHRFGVGHFSLLDPMTDNRSHGTSAVPEGYLVISDRSFERSDSLWWVVVMPRRPRRLFAFVKYSNDAPRSEHELHRQTCQRRDCSYHWGCHDNLRCRCAFHRRLNGCHG